MGPTYGPSCPTLLPSPSNLYIDAYIFRRASSGTIRKILAGCAVTGIWAADVLSMSIKLALEMTRGKRKGFFDEVFNVVFTLGVSLGAIVAGGLSP